MLQREPEPGGIGEELLLREPRRLGFHVAGGSHDPVQKCLLLACRRRGVAEHGVPALLRDEAHIQGPRYGRQLTATAAAVFAGGRPSGGFGGGCAALRNRRHAGRYRIRRAATMGRRQRRCGVGRARLPCSPAPTSAPPATTPPPPPPPPLSSGQSSAAMLPASSAAPFPSALKGAALIYQPTRACSRRAPPPAARPPLDRRERDMEGRGSRKTIKQMRPLACVRGCGLWNSEDGEKKALCALGLVLLPVRPCYYQYSYGLPWWVPALDFSLSLTVPWSIGVGVDACNIKNVGKCTPLSLSLFPHLCL